MNKTTILWLSVIVAGGLIGLAIISSGESNNMDNQKNSAVQNNINENTPVLGDPQAPVTIVEYGDFQCPVCNRFFRGAKPQIEEEYIKTGKANLVFKDFAFIGPESQRAAEAAQCANAQDTFWEYHDALYNFIWDNYYARGVNGENAGAFTKSNLQDLAKEVGLNTEQFSSCLDSETYEDVVSGNKEDGLRQDVRGTPTFFINGEKVVGAQPFSVFSQIIESKLGQ